MLLKRYTVEAFGTTLYIYKKKAKTKSKIYKEINILNVINFFHGNLVNFLMWYYNKNL